jgi:hypothetical protein
MENLKVYLSKNKLYAVLILFIIIFASIHYVKPSLVYNENGEFRPFGIGYRHKTIIPIWIVSIITAIFSYLIVLSFMMYL